MLPSYHQIKWTKRSTCKAKYTSKFYIGIPMEMESIKKYNKRRTISITRTKQRKTINIISNYLDLPSPLKRRIRNIDA